MTDTLNQLSATAKAKYLQNPGHCPVCAANQIDGSQIEVDGKQARQEVTCTACGFRWEDIYTLTTIEVCQ